MKNAIYHSDNLLKLSGFIAENDSDKEKSEKIYWKWDFETGQTQEEKDSNNLADSDWIGKSISLSINVTGKQVNENPLNNQYAVTFDANGGTLQGYGNATQATRLVNYGEGYGELPVPTREGYRFVGWSRNLADTINEQNYTCYHFNSRTTNELRNDEEIEELIKQPYIRINGNKGESHIDTSWRITENNSFKVTAGKTYVLSFYTRSEKSVPTQYFGRYIHENSGKTYIEWNDGTTTYLSKDIEFDNDGNWHLITETITVPDGIVGAKIIIGNDIPNIYGPDSYIDIANIQFTEGTIITPYWIQSSTRVAVPDNHVLIAKWEKIE